MNPTHLNDIIAAVKHAKAKHPFFAPNLGYAMSIAGEEFGEMAKAVNEVKIDDVRAEALDLIAVCVRILEMVDEL